MIQKNKSLIKNIGLFTVGSFGSKLVSFFMVPLYTAVLSTTDYGTVDLLNSTAQLITPFLLLSIQDATLRFSMDPNYKKDDVMSTSMKIVGKGSLFLLFALAIIYKSHITNWSFTYFIFLFFTFFLSSINNCMNLFLKACNKASVIVISGILCTLVSCVSNIICLLVFKLGINGYMISIIIGIAIQVLYQLVLGKLYKAIHIKRYNDLSKPMIKYSIPLIANSVAWWINNASDRYILTWMCGVAVTGIYSVAYKIPTILTTFQSVFYNAWSISAISEFDKDDTDGFIGNNYSTYGFVSIVVCSFLILINIPIAKMLYFGEFYSAWKCVPFLLVGTVFNGISQFEGSLFAAVKKTKAVAMTTVLGAFLNTVCNFIFIPLWGAIGAAVATMAAYCLTWILRTVIIQEFITMKVKWNIHIVAIVLLIVEAVLATFNCLVGVQIFIVFLIVLLHKDYIKNVFKARLGAR